MVEHRAAPRPEDDLGGEFVAGWRARIAELDERASGVDLGLLLAPSELERLRSEVRVTVAEDPDTFLRRQVVVFVGLELQDPDKQLGFVGYIGRITDEIHYGDTFS